MSSPAYRPPSDAAQRAQAIDPRGSFLVQAPAGSGKTELLIQRFLRLLAVVERPEAIVAITFTRKAAGEMVQRIIEALRGAQAEAPQEQTPEAKPHRQLTRTLAEAAIQRDRELGWNILEHPARLRVQTIDSLCVAIAAEMPWLARLGAMPGIEENARDLYEEAARRAVLLAGDPKHGDAVLQLLRHLDNDAPRARDLIASMLGTREQWIALAVQVEQSDRQPLEAALQRSIARRCNVADELVPMNVRDAWLGLVRYSGREVEEWPGAANPQAWKLLTEIVLTASDEWRKQVTVKEGFPSNDRARKLDATKLIEDLRRTPGMQEALSTVRGLPPPRYSEPQWLATLALLRSLTLAVAQLKIVFREKSVADFAEIGMSGSRALGDGEQATDLAFRLDARIEHLLVDEFQDTSRGQIELIRRLTANWQPGDGRTLFLVGDPMQSIYRFRQAEVGIFLETRANGIGDLRPQPLNLVSNYRSDAGIVDRINQIFEQLFPKEEDSATGAVRFHRSEASEPNSTSWPYFDAGVTIHGFALGEDLKEAGRVVHLIREAQSRAPEEKIAVLVRARTHLPRIVEALKAERMRFQAVEIDPLAERTVVLDLLALTRAMLHRADRIAWLAILRAPWCGLGLADLEKIGRREGSIWNALDEINLSSEDGLGRLSKDGRSRVARLRSVLAEAFEERGRWPLRRWVERAWIQLGGPACLEGDEGAFADARAYFDHLEARQSGSDLPDLPQLEKGLAELFAQPDPNASERLQIMTIHKAKGLEFDTVIVAGLGRPDKMDDAQLVLFHEWGEDGEVERLLAPYPRPGNKDPIYDYLRDIESSKNRLERVRLLYVAATRAKKNLHLLGQAKIKNNGEPSADGRSMLGDLWVALTEEERASFAKQSDAEESPPSAEIPTEPKFLRRISLDWTPPALAESLALPAGLSEAHEPTFEWVGESLRIAGTVVHELLRRARNRAIDVPPASKLSRLLRHAGVIPAELGITRDRVTEALARMQRSARAQWILDDHREARAEYAISGMENGEIVHGKVDRTFIDASGIRWIVDFKTSVHQGGSLAEFLDEQQRRYGDQLTRYARLLSPLGQPVRVGLYFPLLDEWREWLP